MAGLRKICRLLGSLKAGDMTYVWDYAAEEPVPEAEMLFGSERWKESERAKYTLGKQGKLPEESEGLP